jgi:hypothetical protein
LKRGVLDERLSERWQLVLHELHNFVVYRKASQKKAKVQ